MELLATSALVTCRLVALLCVAVTALAITPWRSWWVRAWDFPRQQIALLSAVVGLMLAPLAWPTSGLDLALLTSLVAALGYQLNLILPYTPLWPRQALTAGGPRGQRCLRLVTVNVLMTNREVDGLAATLRATEPDLVLALETDRWWIDRLEEMLPDHRHRVLHPLDNTYGIALFSRLELARPEVRELLKPDIPSIRTGVRLPSGETVLLLGVHPEPPSPTEASTSLPRDAELVLIGREVAGTDRPVIVMGDLNDVAWSHTSRLFRRLSGTVDPRVGRGFFNSFDARRRWVRWPLDHVFYTPDFLVRELRRLPAFGSDHFPIMIDLEYQPRAAAKQEIEPADAEDRVEARETLAEARRAVPG